MPVSDYNKLGSPPLYHPTDDLVIVKYMDLTKFISLLSTKSLFFCRLDKLEDQFEGVTAAANFQHRVDWYKYHRETGFFVERMSDEQIIAEVKEQYVSERKMKSRFLVNCWNKKQHESAALWKIYSDFNKGIMIESSILNLKECLKKSKPELFLSEIKYLDYAKERMPDGNIFNPVIHKQNAYSYEDEVRLIRFIDDGKFSWDNQKVQEGIYIKCDLNILIEKIVLSPFSPQWYFDLMESICRNFKCKKTVVRSSLSILNNGV